MADDTGRKRPAFQFYPADWRKDVELQSCSMAAQGLWINAMCVAHECEPYGHLTINGRPMNFAQLGRQVGLSAKEAEGLMTELLEAGVAKRLDDGSIFSKRMVDDEALRNVRAAGGKSGAEHGAKGAEAGSKGGRPAKNKGGSETPLADAQKPPPSSSSSSSPSGLFPEDESSVSPDTPATGSAADAGMPVEPMHMPEPMPPCPHRQLLALFAELVPELPRPRVELWEDSKGAEAMRARWKWLLTATREGGERYAETQAEGIAWMRRFFETVKASDFLTGRNGTWTKCDLTWLMNRENFRKVVDNQYANR